MVDVICYQSTVQYNFWLENKHYVLYYSMLNTKCLHERSQFGAVFYT